MNFQVPQFDENMEAPSLAEQASALVKKLSDSKKNNDKIPKKFIEESLASDDDKIRTIAMHFQKIEGPADDPEELAILARIDDILLSIDPSLGVGVAEAPVGVAAPQPGSAPTPLPEGGSESNESAEQKERIDKIIKGLPSSSQLKAAYDQAFNAGDKYARKMAKKPRKEPEAPQPIPMTTGALLQEGYSVYANYVAAEKKVRLSVAISRGERENNPEVKEAVLKELQKRFDDAFGASVDMHYADGQELNNWEYYEVYHPNEAPKKAVAEQAPLEGVKEAEADLSNTIEMTTNNAANAIMDQWGMEIKNDHIFVNGEELLFFKDSKAVDISADGSSLVIIETTMNGDKIESKGSDASELLDHMFYNGLGYLSQKEKDFIAKDIDALKSRRPEWFAPSQEAAVEAPPEELKFSVESIAPSHDDVVKAINELDLKNMEAHETKYLISDTDQNIFLTLDPKYKQEGEGKYLSVQFSFPGNTNELTRLDVDSYMQNLMTAIDAGANVEGASQKVPISPVYGNGYEIKVSLKEKVVAEQIETTEEEVAQPKIAPVEEEIANPRIVAEETVETKEEEVNPRMMPEKETPAQEDPAEELKTADVEAAFDAIQDSDEAGTPQVEEAPEASLADAQKAEAASAEKVAGADFPVLQSDFLNQETDAVTAELEQAETEAAAQKTEVKPTEEDEESLQSQVRGGELDVNEEGLTERDIEGEEKAEAEAKAQREQLALGVIEAANNSINIRNLVEDVKDLPASEALKSIANQNLKLKKDGGKRSNAGRDNGFAKAYLAMENPRVSDTALANIWHELGYLEKKNVSPDKENGYTPQWDKLPPSVAQQVDAYLAANPNMEISEGITLTELKAKKGKEKAIVALDAQGLRADSPYAIPVENQEAENEKKVDVLGEEENIAADWNIEAPEEEIKPVAENVEDIQFARSAVEEVKEEIPTQEVVAAEVETEAVVETTEEPKEKLQITMDNVEVLGEKSLEEVLPTVEEAVNSFKAHQQNVELPVSSIGDAAGQKEKDVSTTVFTEGNETVLQIRAPRNGNLDDLSIPNYVSEVAGELNASDNVKIENTVDGPKYEIRVPSEVKETATEDNFNFAPSTVEVVKEETPTEVEEVTFQPSSVEEVKEEAPSIPEVQEAPKEQVVETQEEQAEAVTEVQGETTETEETVEEVDEAPTPGETFREEYLTMIKDVQKLQRTFKKMNRIKNGPRYDKAKAEFKAQYDSLVQQREHMLKNTLVELNKLDPDYVAARVEDVKNFGMVPSELEEIENNFAEASSSMDDMELRRRSMANDITLLEKETKADNWLESAPDYKAPKKEESPEEEDLNDFQFTPSTVEVAGEKEEGEVADFEFKPSTVEKVEADPLTQSIDLTAAAEEATTGKEAVLDDEAKIKEQEVKPRIEQINRTANNFELKTTFAAKVLMSKLGMKIEKNKIMVNGKEMEDLSSAKHVEVTEEGGVLKIVQTLTNKETGSDYSIRFEGKTPEELLANLDASWEKYHADRAIADEFMAGLDFGANSESGALDGMGGIASLDADMQGGLGGVIGAKGVQAGSGGLGSRGSGLGTGGTADGIGGLGTKGAGRGSTGYGKGGGTVGKKRSGGSIKGAEREKNYKEMGESSLGIGTTLSALDAHVQGETFEKGSFYDDVFDGVSVRIFPSINGSDVTLSVQLNANDKSGGKDLSGIIQKMKASFEEDMGYKVTVNGNKLTYKKA